jgi:hypothetical protein
VERQGIGEDILGCGIKFRLAQATQAVVGYIENYVSISWPMPAAVFTTPPFR